MTADGDNPDAFEDLNNGYALRENGGLDRSAKLLQTLEKPRQPERIPHCVEEPVAQNEDKMLCETFKQLRRDMKAATLTSAIGGAKMPLP